MTAPHDPPSAAQLVEAVREYLERDVLDATDGRIRFHARVAINALSMVEREMALGPAQAVEHRARLDGLGFPDDVGLAGAIRRGELDGRYAEVKEALVTMVGDKLAVASPDYGED